MPTPLRQESFGAGEFSPSLWSKTRFARYGAGARKLLNFLVTSESAAANRSGTGFVAPLRDHAQRSYLLPFVFSDDDTLLLEFGQQFIRFYRYVPEIDLTGQVEASPGVPLEVATPYAVEDIPDLRWAQVGDVVTLVHGKYQTKELKRLGPLSWTLTPFSTKRPLSFPLTTAWYMTWNQSGDSSHVAKAWAWVVTAVDAEGNESAQSAPIYPPATADEATSRKVALYSDRPHTLKFEGAPGAISHNVYRGRNGLYGYVGSTEKATPLLGDEGRHIVTFEDDGQGPDYTRRPPRDVEAFEVLIWAPRTRFEAADVVEAGPRVYQCIQGGITGNAMPIATDASVIDGATDDWAPNTDYAVGDLRRNLGETWRCSVAGHSAAAGPGPSVVGNRGVTDGTAHWTWVGTGNACRWKYLGPAPAAKRWPSLACFYEGRLALGGSDFEPETVRLSRVDQFHDHYTFQGAPADAPVKVAFSSKKAEAIRWLLPFKGLVAGTSSSEWVVTGEGENEAIKAGSVARHRGTEFGSAKIEPLAVGEDVLFIRRTGKPLILQAQNGGYVPFDPTLLAGHLFKGRRIVRWAYAESPWSICYGLFDDGTLGAFTYVRAHDIWAWTPLQLAGDGYVEDLCTLPEGNEDGVYVIVRRTVNGATRRYIERFTTREIDEVEEGCFLDCSLSYDGAPVRHFGGLDHLEGQDVVALADGDVVRGLRVQGGAVDLSADIFPDGASRVHIGLPYVSDFESLDAPPGEARNRLKAVSSVAIEVAASRGGYLGQRLPKDPTSTKGLEEVRQREPEHGLGPVPLVDGFYEVPTISEWNKGGRCAYRQIDPLPVTILAVVRQVEYGQ